MVHAPLSNVNGSLVNVDSSTFSATAFSNRVIPSTINPNSLPEPLNNIDAAKSYISCKGYKGGGKLWNKIKKISMKYKMPKKGSVRRKMSQMRKKVKSILKRTKSKSKTRSKSKKGYTRKRRSNTKKRVRFQKGGWAQYQNNLPMTQTFSTGGVLKPSDSALANPVPFKTLSNCTNCIDNYSKYTNWGFPSKGWF